MLKNKIYVVFVLLLIEGFLISASAADENVEQKIDNSQIVKSKMHSKIESSIMKQKSDAFTGRTQSQSTATVVLELKGSDRSYIKSLEKNGAVIQTEYKNLVQASVPYSQIEAISNLQFVNFIRNPRKAYKHVVSEGVGVINASLLHNNGFRGQGVKIAIIDLGFEGYQSILGTELPNTVTVQSFRADGDITGGGEVHGTAVAEIVHDVAPDAQLYLINFDTDVEFANAVDYAISQNADIISMSVGWFVGPFDGTGFLDDVVNNASSSGVVWVNSAGNSAESHWEGMFNDPNNNGIHNFMGSDETISINLASADDVAVFLSWDDWPASNQDYDLCVYDNPDAAPLGCSENIQNGSQEPVEFLGDANIPAGTYYFKILKYDATRNVKFHLFSANQDFNYKVASGSITIPADAQGAITAGATYWSDDALEPFSSQGPTNDGRIKPDIAAPDGVSTSAYGAGGFYGTSASAPHTAGVAALLLSANYSLTPAQVKAALETGAKDLGAPGKDNQTGAGRIDAWGSYQRIISKDIRPPASITNLKNKSYAMNYINWTWTDPKDSDFTKVMVYINGIFKTNVTKGKKYYNATGLIPNTSYKISTHTVDTSGNINKTWINHTARTKPDSIPPRSVTNLKNTSYDYNYIIWNWKDPVDYDFAKVMVYINGRFKTSVAKGTQYYIATSLTNNTLYTISTRTVDTSGNINKTWINHTARTSRFNTPPSPITNLKNISYACTYINWTWTNPKNPDLAYVKVYLDGVFKANVPKGVQYYKATALLPNTLHKISTHTVDTLGSINPTWVNNTAKTAPCTLSALIVNDDNDIYYDDDQSISVFESAFKSIGYNVTVETSSNTSNSTWNKYGIIVWSAGDDPEPTYVPKYRKMLVDYVTHGGHLILEGGEIAAYNKRFVGDREFREKVLHATNDWVYSDVGNLTLSNRHPVSTIPYVLPATIKFEPTNPGELSSDADAVRILTDAKGVYNWSSVASGGEPINQSVARISYGLIAYDNDADVNNGGQIVYYAFDIDDIYSSDIQRKLIVNSERWLR